MHVGWIGLGRVGMQMALVTLAAGHQVTGHSRSFDRHAEVEAAGESCARRLRRPFVMPTSCV